MKTVEELYHAPDGREYPVGGPASYYGNLLQDDAGEPVERCGTGQLGNMGS